MTPLVGMLVALVPVYVRIQAMLLVLPGFGDRVLPVRVKVALAMALTPMFAPVADAAVPPTVLVVAAELLTGLALGTLVRIMALALDVAATTLAQSASLSQLLGISDDMPPHPIGNLLHLAGMAVLMAMGLPILLCQLIGDSFALRPVGGWPAIAEFLPLVTSMVADSFALAMALAAPFILGGLLFQLLSGVVARVMPALPVVFVAAPAAVLLALVALILLAPPLLALWAGQVLDLQLPGAG